MYRGCLRDPKPEAAPPAEQVGLGHPARVALQLLARPAVRDTKGRGFTPESKFGDGEAAQGRIADLETPPQEPSRADVRCSDRARMIN